MKFTFINFKFQFQLYYFHNYNFILVIVCIRSIYVLGVRLTIAVIVTISRIKYLMFQNFSIFIIILLLIILISFTFTVLYRLTRIGIFKFSNRVYDWVSVLICRPKGLLQLPLSRHWTFALWKSNARFLSNLLSNFDLLFYCLHKL